MHEIAPRIPPTLDRHDLMTEALIRNPGEPPSQCRGRLVRVDGGDAEIPWDAPGTFDDCLTVEGEPGQKSEIRLFRCAVGRITLVVAICPDGTLRLRNRWPKSVWDRDAGKPVDEPEAAVAQGGNPPAAMGRSGPGTGDPSTLPADGSREKPRAFWRNWH